MVMNGEARGVHAAAAEQVGDGGARGREAIEHESKGRASHVVSHTTSTGKRNHRHSSPNSGSKSCGSASNLPLQHAVMSRDAVGQSENLERCCART